MTITNQFLLDPKKGLFWKEMSVSGLTNEIIVNIYTNDPKLLSYAVYTVYTVVVYSTYMYYILFYINKI